MKSNLLTLQKSCTFLRYFYYVGLVAMIAFMTQMLQEFNNPDFARNVTASNLLKRIA